VAVSARDERRLQEFAAAHPGSLALPLDVTDREALRAAAARAPGSRSMIALIDGLMRSMRRSSSSKTATGSALPLR
jgi:NADP-dependent 3-hydroxy acid dehydrogenase YdfG